MNVAVPLLVYGATALAGLTLGLAIPRRRHPVATGAVLLVAGLALVPAGALVLATVGGLAGVAVALAGLVHVASTALTRPPHPRPRHRHRRRRRP
jgi:Na+/proline symporter